MATSPSDYLEQLEDAAESLQLLVDSATPYIIGVRHHSPSMSARVAAMLDAYKPDVVLIELPMEFDHWLEWLGHADMHAPVALASVHKESAGGLSFYPFADFSPELAAVRWAVANKVEVHPCDLPSGVRLNLNREYGEYEPVQTITDRLQRSFFAEDFESLWDRLVEVHADSTDAEGVRRAGLYVGWALRHDAIIQGGIDVVDLARETHMRARIEEAGGWSGKKVAVVVGSFHAAALLEQPQMWGEMPHEGDPEEMVTSLIPYSFELLDSRSGYPAGIRDPKWQQDVFDAVQHERSVEEVISTTVVQICRQMRAFGQVAGVPDADSAARMACDLANIRGLAAPGRQEVLESIQSAMARGEILGRGRILARAMDRVMIGRRRGRLAAKTPRSGLAPSVEATLAELNLPGPSSQSEEPKTLRLDPLRSERDRLRHVTLQRLSHCQVPYGDSVAGQAIGSTSTLTKQWDVKWRPSTDAMLELASIWGVTLEQATRGAIQVWESRLRAEDEYVAASMLQGARMSAECGLADLAENYIRELAGPFLEQSDLVGVLSAMALIDEIEKGHIPGLSGPDAIELPEGLGRRDFLAAAVRALEGVEGSEAIGDAQALIELVSMFRHQEASDELGTSRLYWLIDHFAQEASELMQGAATAAQVLTERLSSEQLATRLSSWMDAAVDVPAQRILTKRLNGFLVAAGSLLESEPDCLLHLINRINGLDDGTFLKRLPSLRRGFDVLSASARERLLGSMADAFPSTMDPRGHGQKFMLSEHPEVLAMWTQADMAGKADVERLVGADALADDAKIESAVTEDEGGIIAANGSLDALTRWRLILGRQRDKLSGMGASAARALDQLYGGGDGEGSGSLTGQGGGKEDGFPTARDWAEELEALFGQSVRDEVLAQAGEQGFAAALLELDGENVTPSIELLESVLSLKGGLNEGQLSKLRSLVRRVVDELVRELAQRLRPALTGLTTPRPTLRKGGPIDLPRTISANLDKAREVDGVVTVVPEKIYFKTRAKRAVDWHVSLVVDVSGSMEPSVIYSAMMAAILHGIPSVSTQFYAFNTEVIDLSDFVDDPLALLLEVDVGGGTHIAKALKYARNQMPVPQRSIVILVSDFEEGWSTEGLVKEVRDIAESGAHVLGLAALDDRGAPRYNKAIASMCVAAGMPVAALTPLELARWVGEKINAR